MMWTIRITRLFASVAAAAFLLVVPVEASLIYDFESPTYTGGDVTINGQDGWTGGSATVITTVAPDQLLRIGANQTASHSLAGAGFGALSTVSFRTFITNNTNSYGEMQLFDSANTKYAHIGLQNSTDHFYAYDNVGLTNFDTNSVAGGNFYDVVVTLDFAAQKYRTTYTHEPSAALHADTGFINFVAATTPALAEGGRIDLLGGSASSRFAYFDDVSIVPEPNSAMLVAMGAIGLFVARRRKLEGK